MWWQRSWYKSWLEMLWHHGAFVFQQEPTGMTSLSRVQKNIRNSSFYIYNNSICWWRSCDIINYLRKATKWTLWAFTCHKLFHIYTRNSISLSTLNAVCVPAHHELDQNMFLKDVSLVLCCATVNISCGRDVKSSQQGASYLLNVDNLELGVL